VSIYKGLCGAAMRSVTTITEPMFSVFFALYSTGYFSPCHAAVVRCNAMQYNISIYNARMVSLRAESEAWPVARGKDGEARV